MFPLLNRQQIIDLLKKNPDWEPDEDAPQKVWEIFDDVYQMLEDQGLLGINADTDTDEDTTENDNEDEEKEQGETGDQDDDYWEDDDMDMD
ncbi:hypothetical protein JXA34_01635 [Patescibacteria group bacterium]|nr:hypothetical protein [Patescibacteria group bacterium]